MKFKLNIVKILLFILLCQMNGKIYSAIFSVTNNADNGAGSLRQAMLNINASALAGPHTIDFSGMTATSAGQTITLSTDLPVLTKPTIIDGSTAPLYGTGTYVWIKGVTNVFSFTNSGANGSTIRAIVMTKTSSYGVYLSGVSNINVEGCWIGLDNTGAIPGGAASNKIGSHGIYINNSTFITIGGTTAAQRNVIGGINGATSNAIHIDGSASNITIIGNYIGLNTLGTAARANPNYGIYATTSSNIFIGGSNSSSRNVISSSAKEGIYLDKITTGTISGNYIGTNAAGSAAVANALHGITVANSSSGITIGGTTLGTGNVISGNTASGINIITLSHGTTIKGNYIGLNAAGTAALSNGTHGIFSTAVNNLVIGGSSNSERNIISGNGNAAAENGISIDNSTGHVIKGNFIGTNANGLAAIPNYDSGISLTAVSGLTIGGSNFMDRNVISGNGAGGGKFGLYASNMDASTITGNFIGVDSTGNAGLANTNNGASIQSGSDNNTWTSNVFGKNTNMGLELLNSTANTFYGNKFGLGYDGTTCVGNGTVGLRIGTSSTSNTIGGTAAGQRNYISCNGDNALMVDQNANSNIIKGNYVGSDVTGLVAKGNSAVGIFVFENSNSNQIGGTAAGEGNLVCCSVNNAGIGLQVSSNNIVYGNNIGADANLARTAGFGNKTSGVFVISHTDAISSIAQSNIIGGIAAGQSNIITNNGSNGISFQYIAGTLQYNSAIGNKIYCNSGGPGITFSGTPIQESVATPTITSRTLTAVSGTGTTGNTIHVYWSSTGDGGVKCNCEAETYLGTTTVAGGTWSFTFTTPFTLMSDVNTVTVTQTTTNKSTSQLASCSTPLPVTWVSVDAKSVSNTVFILWSTANELNNKFFEIERSKDGISFSSIGSVLSQGNTNGIKNYQFIDAQPEEGYNYYRIKQVDIDGRYSYSEIKTVNNQSNASELAVWPNPSTGIFNYTANTINAFIIEVYSSLGNLVLTESINSGNENLIHQVDLSNLSTGIYQIKVITSESIKYSQVIKY
jgi:titin